MARFFKTPSWTQRRFSGWLNASQARRGVMSTRLMILIIIGIPVLVILGLILLFITKGPHVFYESVPGTRSALNVMLKSNAESVRQHALGTLQHIGKLYDSCYFDAYLDICLKRGHEESAACFPMLLGCIKEDDVSPALEKIRPILRKYRNDPRFLFWSARCIRIAGTPAEMTDLENTYRAVLRKNPDYNDVSILRATEEMFELKPETAPYDRLVELELAPVRPQEMATKSFVRSYVFRAVKGYFSQYGWSYDYERDPRKLAKCRKVQDDTRIVDFLFYADWADVKNKPSYPFCSFDALSVAHRQRYLDLVYQYLMTIPETRNTRGDTATHWVAWVESNGHPSDCVAWNSYYEFIKRMRDSKWERWPNPYYEANPEHPGWNRYNLNFKTYGEICQKVLDEKAAAEARESEAVKAYRGN